MDLHGLASFADKADGFLSKIILAFAILLLAFGAYVIWDNLSIEQGAVDNDFLQYRPIPGRPETYSLRDLKKINPDVVGWITVKGTHIDYPVVRGKDNLEYINKNVKGDFSYSGSIFLDSACDEELKDPYLLLYGHHMSGNGMFSDVSRFLSQEYLDTHRHGYLFGDGYMRPIIFFACVATSASDAQIYNVRSIEAEGTALLLRYVRQKAKTYTGDPVTSGDIIALSTCAEATSNGRYVLLGKLGPSQGETDTRHALTQEPR